MFHTYFNALAKGLTGDYGEVDSPRPRNVLFRTAVQADYKGLHFGSVCNWRKFVGAETRSKEYQTLLAEGLTRSLVAMRAEDGSTRTVGYMLLQLLFGLLTAGGFDRLLSGPTNEVWLNPWLSYLKQCGVTMNVGVTVQQIHAGSSGVTSVSVEGNGQTRQVTADYYIAAMPVEIMAGLVTDELKQLAPSLAGLNQLPTRWMNGIQFYLAQDVPLEHGHILYADSLWH